MAGFTKINFAKVIGANTDYATAQAFVFPKDVHSEDLEQNYLAVIISATGEDVFTKVRQTAPEIEEVFFSLEEALPVRLESILAHIKLQLEGTENLQILLVSWKENVLYLLSLGSHQAYLKRNGQVMNLSKSTGQLISGHILPSDRLLLVSSKTTELEEEKDVLWDQKIINEIIDTPLDSLEVETTLSMQKSDHLEPIAVILIENKEEIAEPSGEEESIPEIDEDRPVRDRLKIFQTLRFIRVFLGSALRNKKIRGGILAGVLILAVLSGGLYFYQKTLKKNESGYLAILDEAKGKYDNAQNLKDSDPEQAKKSLEEAKSKADEAIKLRPKDSRAQALKDEIDKGSNSILKVGEITDWPLFLSLDLIKKDFKAGKMSYSVGKVLLLDEDQKTLVLLDLAKKTNQILAGSQQLGDAKFATLNGESAYAYSDDKGILKIDLGNSKVSTVSKPDAEWGKISDIYGFSGNVYALDSLKNQIWKYSPTKSGYSDKFTYIRDGQKIDLAGGIELRIDYSVWVLKTGPDILRFTAGASDHFSVGGLDKPLKNIKSFYVGEGKDSPTEETSYAYFLDSENSRLLALKKNGQYAMQYKGDKFATASDFAVNESEGKLYLLDDNRIYQVDLK